MNPEDMKPVLFAGLSQDDVNTGLIPVNVGVVKQAEAAGPVDWSRMFWMWTNPSPPVTPRESA